MEKKKISSRIVVLLLVFMMLFTMMPTMAWADESEGVDQVEKVNVYFLDHENCFGRDGVYGTKSEPDFFDNPYRFSLLCHGALQVCNKLGWFPDIVHAHDWSAALAPVLVKHVCRTQEAFKKTASVFTIHNMGYQGVYGKDKYKW